MAERLGDWLAQRPFALAMSSGFFSFFAHTGFLQSLTGRGLLPQLVAGSSAGALVGGAWAAGVDADAIAERFATLRREDFWDPTLGAGLLAGKKFDRLLRELLPITDMRRTRVPVRASVFDIARRRTTVLHDADLAHAIRASCAVPALFHPVWVEHGGARRAYWDGGILDRPGLAGIPVGERVLFHHISSQSPWRVRPPSPPTRAGMVTLVIDGLPRSGPFKLDAGREALARAREATLRALDAPIEGGVVRVSAR